MPGPANQEEEATPKYLGGPNPRHTTTRVPRMAPAIRQNRKPPPRRKRRRFPRSNIQQPLPGLGLYTQSIMPLAKRKNPKFRIQYPYPRRRRPQTADGLQQGIPGLETNPQSAKTRQLEQEKETARKRQMRYIRPWTRRLILRRDNYMCVYCGADLRKIPPKSTTASPYPGKATTESATCNPPAEPATAANAITATAPNSAKP